LNNLDVLLSSVEGVCYDDDSGIGFGWSY